MTHRIKSLLVWAAALGGVLGATARAGACGGFFCSQVQPVNQSAERIVFANNGDGTQTAVIEIMYEGPSEHFSWLLPISSVPMGDQIQVASDIAFTRLQSATNPQYTLTTTIEGTCKPQQTPSGTGAGGSSAVGTGGSGGSGGGAGGVDMGVHVEASGVIGAFEWTVISLDPNLTDPAAAAVEWLGMNGFDVPDGAPALIGPYLMDGNFLLALKLTKGSDVGSIRPIVLTYDGTKPLIPIKLTAVAANDDMGVMAWVLGDSRAVPVNYYSLELNEARINWFNPSLNYNEVVTAAADDTGSGQGFVTELAGPTTALANVVWPQYEEQRWQSVKGGVYQSFDQLFQALYNNYQGYDGFWDAVKVAVTLPVDVDFDSFKLCPSCYSADITYKPSELMAEIENQVIEPVRVVQKLIDGHTEITRFYTTMSAMEMTADPVFSFNADLEDVSNVHTATRVIECNPSIYQYEAPWRIEFPQGGTLRGTAQDVGTWPAALGNQPPNRVITRAAESGPGKVLDDQSDEIDMMLDAYNKTVPAPAGSGGAGGTAGTGGTGGSKGGTGGVAGTTGSGGSSNGGAGVSGGVGGTGNDEVLPSGNSDDGGCSVSTGRGSDAPLASLVGLLLVAARRRRSRCAVR